jgi:hypothetical protein
MCFFAFLLTVCRLRVEPCITTLFAMCSAGDGLTHCLVLFGSIQERGSYDGAKWAQNNEFDKLACEPCLPTRCVGSIKHMAFKLRSCVENMVLYRFCYFRSDCADSPFVMTRQSWDRFRFARMDFA